MTCMTILVGKSYCDEDPRLITSIAKLVHLLTVTSATLLNAGQS